MPSSTVKKHVSMFVCTHVPAYVFLMGGRFVTINGNDDEKPVVSFRVLNGQSLGFSL